MGFPQRVTSCAFVSTDSEAKCSGSGHLSVYFCACALLHAFIKIVCTHLVFHVCCISIAKLEKRLLELEKRLLLRFVPRVNCKFINQYTCLFLVADGLIYLFVSCRSRVITLFFFFFFFFFCSSRVNTLFAFCSLHVNTPVCFL